MVVQLRAAIALRCCLCSPVAQKDRPASPPKDTKAAADKGKGKDKAKGKIGKDKDKDKSKDGSRPVSQQFDHTKPNWILRIISDGPAAVSSGPERSVADLQRFVTDPRQLRNRSG